MENRSAETLKTPRVLEQYLYLLSKHLEHDRNRRLQEVVVNAVPELEEVYSSYGDHTSYVLRLQLQENLYFNLRRDKSKVEEQLKEHLSGIVRIDDESIHRVVVEALYVEDSEWRAKSGLLLPGKRVVTQDVAAGIWGVTGYRVFISHRSTDKKYAHDLAQQLKSYGILPFVAHDAIRTSKDWQEEIEKALATMNAFVAILSKDFNKGGWTDQEVGYALAMGVPRIAIRRGRDPYAFIGRFQALPACNPEGDAEAIVAELLGQSRMTDAFIRAMTTCKNPNEAILLGRVLRNLRSVSRKQIDDLVAAYNANSVLRDIPEFNGRGTAENFSYGLGIRLSELDKERRFVVDASSGLIIDSGNPVPEGL